MMGALPSSNAVFIDVLFTLSEIFENPTWHKFAWQSLNKQVQMIEKYPSSFAYWANLLLIQHGSLVKVHIIGPNAANLFKELSTKEYNPYVSISTSKDVCSEIEIFKGKHQRGETLIYVCKEQHCLSPTTKTQEAWGAIGKYIH